jgi:hypothetical protein
MTKDQQQTEDQRKDEEKKAELARKDEAEDRRRWHQGMARDLRGIIPIPW